MCSSDQPVLNGRARQMPGDLALVGLHDLFNVRLGFRLLDQNDLTNDRIDIGIGEFHADGETPFKFLQVAGAGHGRLTGANEEQFAANVLATGFHHFLDIDGALTVFTDVLLHLVEHHQRQREFAILRQDPAEWP